MTTYLTTDIYGRRYNLTTKLKPFVRVVSISEFMNSNYTDVCCEITLEKLGEYVIFRSYDSSIDQDFENGATVYSLYSVVRDTEFVIKSDCVGLSLETN